MTDSVTAMLCDYVVGNLNDEWEKLPMDARGVNSTLMFRRCEGERSAILLLDGFDEFFTVEKIGDLTVRASMHTVGGGDDFNGLFRLERAIQLANQQIMTWQVICRNIPLGPEPIPQSLDELRARFRGEAG